MSDVSGQVVSEISRLLCEMDPTGPPGLAGSTMAQDAMSLMTINQTPLGGDVSKYEQDVDAPEYDEQELKIAKQFIEMIGSAERARELVDKVTDCQDCLGIVDDSENIEMMANAIPDAPDMPTMGNIAIQFDPNQGML